MVDLAKLVASGLIMSASAITWFASGAWRYYGSPDPKSPDHNPKAKECSIWHWGPLGLASFLLFSAVEEASGSSFKPFLISPKQSILFFLLSVHIARPPSGLFFVLDRAFCLP